MLIKKYGKICLLLILIIVLSVINLARAEELSSKLKGRILLQVQSHGEAWYVNSDNQKRFYLGRPADAFKVMREQGLGVSNKDFNSFNGIAPKKLAGKILLKVEDKGQAYYVSPIDFKMIYLGRPEDAFKVMREQGLGITNDNLHKIIIDKKSSPVIAEEAIIEKPVQEIKVEAPIETATGTQEAIPTETATSTDSGTAGETATSTEEVIPAETATTSCVWLAEYFNNTSVFGAPEATSTVNKIDFDWVRGSPDGINKVDNFSIRYTTDCYFAGGNYEFRTVFDDAIRVYLDNENFLQSWADNNTAKIINRERNIEAGYHEVKVEYYDAIGNAKIKVDWVKID